MMKLWCFHQKEESVSTYNETGHTILLFYQNYEKPWTKLPVFNNRGKNNFEMFAKSCMNI